MEKPEISLSLGDGLTLTEKSADWRVIQHGVFGQLTGTALIHSSQVTRNKTGYRKQRSRQKKKEEEKDFLATQYPQIMQ